MSTSEREIIEVDIVCVGAGVATLSTVLRLLRSIKATGGDAPAVLILEKGATPGAHTLSGAVMDTGPLPDLLTAEEIKALPVEAHVSKESFFRLGARAGIRLPWLPPLMRAHGLPIVSISKLTRHLAELCEAEGAEIYTGFAATELVEDEQGRVTGVRLGDQGVDKNGQPKSNFERGAEVRAKAVVLGEGACGYLTTRLIARRRLAPANRPQSYALGIKEIFEVPAAPERAGEIAHTFGYPADYFTYGGGFVYRMDATRVTVGWAVGLDYRDADFNPHEAFRIFKQHPVIEAHIKGGKAVAYGAKVIPEGGLYALPELVVDGALIVGDSAGLLDTLRLKGIHLAVQSGVAAGDALAACWKQSDFSATALRAYPDRLKSMPAWRQMHRVRNVRAGFAHGVIPGLICSGGAAVLNGMFPWWEVGMEPDHATLRPRPQGKPLPTPSTLNTPLSPDQLTDVFLSGTTHEEDQPCHLKILKPERCAQECIPVYGAPCTRFCPAQVYRLEGDHIHIDFSNCLHCKTCQIKDPLQNIEWTLPQGGDGPKYKDM